MATLVKVHYVGLVRNTVGISGEEIAMRDGSRIRDLLALLRKKHGDSFQYSLFTSDDQLRPMAKVFIEEQEIEQMDGLDTPLGPGAEVSILLTVHPSAGG